MKDEKERRESGDETQETEARSQKQIPLPLCGLGMTELAAPREVAETENTSAQAGDSTWRVG
jgi:hypothetical protein